MRHAAFIGLVLLCGCGAAEAQTRKTVFACDAWAPQVDPNAVPRDRRPFVILLNGGGPFKPYETRDPTRIFGGHQVETFQGHLDGSVDAVAGPSKVKFVGANRFGREGFNFEIETGGKKRLQGFCLAHGKDPATEADVSALADKWLDRK